MIIFDRLNCLRTDHTSAACSACMEACSEEAFVLKGNRLTLLADRCNGCGGCLGGCPSEAIALEGFDENHFSLLFAKSTQESLSCRHNTPCLAVFSGDHLAVMALRKRDGFSCNLSQCEGCQSDPEGHLKAAITARIDQANDLLKQLEHPHTITTQTQANSSDRRSFFAKLLHKAAQSQTAPEKRLVGVSNHATPTPKRRLLLANTLREYASTHPDVTSGLFGHVTLDEAACEGSQACARICPTRAIKMTGEQLSIDPAACIQCGLCEMVCPQKAITAQSTATLLEWLTPRTLAAFKWQTCAQCGTYFVAKAHQHYCRPCGDFVADFGNMFAQEYTRKKQADS